MNETGNAHGVYEITCLDLTGRIKWAERFDNVVTTSGKNLALDTYLSGSSYTVTGPFLGLISSVSFSAVSAADTMASHAGWLEAGSSNAPTYSGSRPVCSWGAASGGSKVLSATAFTFTGAGTVNGAFIVYGSGATNVVGATTGVLYSAGTFGTAQAVAIGDTVNLTYTASI